MYTLNKLLKSKYKDGKTNFAPGEARTLDLRISLSVLTYKYDALTDCATGARIHTNRITSEIFQR